MRSQTLVQLTTLFDAHEKDAVFEANRVRHVFTDPEVQYFAELRATRDALMKEGQDMQTALLARLSSQSLLDTLARALPFSDDPQSTPQGPAQALTQAAPVKAASAWGLACRIGELMRFDQQIPLTALKVLKPLCTCPDRHSMAPALHADHRKYLPEALEWLARYDAPKARELGLSVLLHYVDSEDIVPHELTEALLWALDGIKRWPRDIQKVDVGLILNKLQQQPDQRLYKAVNLLIGRLLCAQH